ncbi:hypothetical protein Ahy_B05g074450 [Arachis hypogaea]|uniref:Uncharacterized protein n=1 Tax=Arachis hypogaea TaxID=3818 RepID=A0A444YYZ3_ARAHY|nr:hypothetical protein Ahy_B05g074450 [Arachis hypogaea]
MPSASLSSSHSRCCEGSAIAVAAAGEKENGTDKNEELGSSLSPPVLRASHRAELLSPSVLPSGHRVSRLRDKNCVPCNLKELRPMTEDAAHTLIPQVSE